MKTSVILGAGFSKNSNIPIQSEIPEYLIKQEDNILDQSITQVIKDFMRDVFGYADGHAIPNMDDIFTCIDISTISGHHLGMSFSPQKLRAIRRMLVYKVYSIIEKRFAYSREVEMLFRILMQNSKTGYVVLNWDTVLEKYLLGINPDIQIDYCNGGLDFRSGMDRSGALSIPVMKVHGSCNWLYCDNCRALFQDMHDDIPLYRRVGLLEDDFKLFDCKSGRLEYKSEYHLESCRICKDYISAHIATFSFRKSFRANSFPSIWSRAEKELTESDKWIFIGYSLPDSDYEFKHLLKIAELKLRHVRKERLKIDVVLLNSEKSITKYEKLFGNSLNYICNEGISGYIKYLQRN